MDDELDQLVSFRFFFDHFFLPENASTCFACLFSHDLKFHKHFHCWNRRIRWWPVSSLVVISEVAAFFAVQHHFLSRSWTQMCQFTENQEAKITLYIFKALFPSFLIWLYQLFFIISLKMAERSEAKNAKQSFASKISVIFKFDAKLRFALLVSLRSTIFSEINMNEQ